MRYAEHLRKGYKDRKELKRIKPEAGNTIHKILISLKRGGLNSYSSPI